jgi:hypothetical protein
MGTAGRKDTGKMDDEESGRQRIAKSPHPNHRYREGSYRMGRMQFEKIGLSLEKCF